MRDDVWRKMMKRFLNLLLVLLLTSAYAGTVFADGPDKKGQAQKLRLSSVKREKYVGIICIWIRIFCGYNIDTGKVWYQKN